MAPPESKLRLLPVKMRTSRGAAITSDWLKKAYREPNTIKCVKPPNSRRKGIYDKNYEPWWTCLEVRLSPERHLVISANLSGEHRMASARFSI
jgi:hypothetical protein